MLHSVAVGGRLGHKKSGARFWHFTYNPAIFGTIQSSHLASFELAGSQLYILLGVYAFGRVEALVQCLHLIVATGRQNQERQVLISFLDSFGLRSFTRFARVRIFVARVARQHLIRC